MTRTRNPRFGFTLTELLVAIVVIGILGAMTMIGLNAAQQSARLAQTRGLVSRINEVIMNHWDDYHFRVLNVQYDPPDPPGPNNSLPQITTEEAARARLIMLRDLMRMELPDRISDLFFVDAATGRIKVDSQGRPQSQHPTAVWAVPTTYFQDSNGVLQPYPTDPTQIIWLAPSSLITYQQQVVSTYAQKNLPVTDWTSQHEGAECLYLILSNLTLNGMPALEMIAPYSIGDTDGDEMPEVVDAWGAPIAFIRWPAGATHPSTDHSSPDEFDLLSSDWYWRYGANDIRLKPFSIRPWIMSAGLDGELGINLQIPVDAYSQMQWPVGRTHGEIPQAGLYFIDPFIRFSSPNASAPVPPIEKPGALVNRETAADNITSFDL